MRVDARPAHAPRSRPARLLRRTHWYRWQTPGDRNVRSRPYRSMKSFDAAPKFVSLTMCLRNAAL
ncbi:hypothetical protein WS48_02290 [Burkholderia sp. RF7-non_BP1]|nr:hypothetical protein WS45_02450 [Burkholderia sp. RF2-non_BP3]KUY83125.1 hypothetical protein WS46_13170 [Burkholderia sp. RF4-BP95]KUY90205.1 hypothetical protein WS49_30090 [Burkholderia sp. RF7-non_BP4]KUZ03440.1 hypothetical protein WS48_02290 [Burkholderia sp. RF7-non_BP1]